MLWAMRNDLDWLISKQAKFRVSTRGEEKPHTELDVVKSASKVEV